MEKEHQPDSMATITMKPEYPPSEVYSTSEPPPAYRQKSSNSVQIARIAALTIVASSFILGSFILASSWVAARASCHQLEQLDAMLDKELALEGRSYGNDGLVANGVVQMKKIKDEPLPIGNAHALHGVPPPASAAAAPAAQDLPPAPPGEAQLKDDTLSHAESKIDEDKLQKLDESSNKESPMSDSEESSESDSEEDDDLDDARPIKLPIQFDLDELAGAFLANSQKGRMNCMVERRRDEPMERGFPFNILGAFAPRAAPQAERIAIICHGGDSSRPMIPEPQSQVFAFPLSGPVRLPLRPQPERPVAPAPAHDVRMPSFAPLANRPGPFPMPLPWESSEEQPREMRIHVQRVFAIPSRKLLPENMPFPPPPPPQQPQQQNEQPTVLHQFVPQPAPTQELEQPEIEKIQLDGNGGMGGLPWGLSPEDLQAIQRAAEDASARRDQQQQIDNDMQQVKSIVSSLAAAAEAEAEAELRGGGEPQHEPAQSMELPEPRAPRTLMLPQDQPMEERPHYMQPRSVRSVDAVLNREKRVKRCACDCDLN